MKTYKDMLEELAWLYAEPASRAWMGTREIIGLIERIYTEVFASDAARAPWWAITGKPNPEALHEFFREQVAPLRGAYWFADWDIQHGHSVKVYGPNGHVLEVLRAEPAPGAAPPWDAEWEERWLAVEAGKRWQPLYNVSAGLPE